MERCRRIQLTDEISEKKFHRKRGSGSGTVRLGVVFDVAFGVEDITDTVNGAEGIEGKAVALK